MNLASTLAFALAYMLDEEPSKREADAQPFAQGQRLATALSAATKGERRVDNGGKERKDSVVEKYVRELQGSDHDDLRGLIAKLDATEEQKRAIAVRLGAID